MSRLLMLLSTGIALLLGVIHLAYTFSGSRLLPRDPSLLDAMQRAPLSLTAETTVWRAWVGFNASHGLGLVLFALVFAYLAMAQPQVLFASNFLLAVGFAMLLCLLVLARVYWFSIPTAGMAACVLCFAASIAAARFWPHGG
ncbi:LIC_13387 family protein [Arenimonas sp. MALMAid1274]|uniref:LIC_13387 family protein n=1 Tax=Arenimonas sp. MALMAid1274 TaxID=3411630 RepID=UPI003B9FE554